MGLSFLISILLPFHLISYQSSDITPVSTFTGSVTVANKLDSLSNQEVLFPDGTVVKYISPKDKNQDIQVLLDRNRDKGVKQNTSENNLVHLSGHDDGPFGNIKKINVGDVVALRDEFGIKKKFRVQDVEDFDLVSIGTGGVPKNKSDSKRLGRLLNKSDGVLLQTCVESGSNGFVVRFVYGFRMI